MAKSRRLRVQWHDCIFYPPECPLFAFRRLLLISLAVLSAPCVAAMAQTALFYQPPSFQLNAVTDIPISFVDMNNDGLPDAVFVSNDNQLQVILHNGTLKPSVLLGCTPTENRAYIALQFVDFNHDGKTDVAFACGNGSLGIALGNGDGTFQQPFYAQLPGGFSLFTLADMNGDGLLDVVAYMTSGSLAGDIVVALSGGGGFTSFHSYPVNGPVNSITTGDFNGDGKKDVASAGTQLVYWLGHGDGTLSAPVTPPEESFAVSVVAADLNGDGIDDLITTSYANYSLIVLFGNTSGVLSIAPDAYPLGEADAEFITVADLTGTGHKDVVLTNFAQSTEIYLNDGTGNLTLSDSYLSYGADSLPQVVDFNGDGHLDIIDQTPGYGEYANGVLTFVPGNDYVLLGNGDGTFQGAPSSLQQSDLYPSFYQTGFTAGDWNGDGLLDFATVSYQPPVTTGNLSIMISRGDGTFTALQGPAVPFGVPVTADLNHDGKPDIVILGLYANAVQVTSCLNNGAAVFTCKPMQALGTTEVHNYPAATVADIDGDGIPDLIFQASSGSSQLLYIAKGNGDGTFAAEKATQISYSGETTQNILVADFNKDGIPDIALNVGANYGTSVLLGAGNGQFTASTYGLVGTPMAVADLNGDTLPDLVTADSNNLYVNLNTGGGTFSSTPASFPLPTVNIGGVYEAFYSPIGIGDVNGDGLPDIVARAPSADSLGDAQLMVLLNAGGGAFTLSPNSCAVGATFTPNPQIFLGKLNRKAIMSGSKTYLDAAVVSTYNLVSELNLNNSSPTDGATTTTALTTSANPVASGATVTFTAKVAPVSGTTAPTGTVIFYAGALTLGSATLNSGFASLTVPTSGLAEGEYPIDAIYSGSSAFQGSPSAVIALSVTQKTAPTESYLTSITSPVNVGSEISLFASVVPIAGSGTPTGTMTFFAQSNNFPLALPWVQQVS